MAEAKKPAVSRLINKSKGLRYVNGDKVMPDNVGIAFSAEQLELAKKNPAFVARLEAGEFEVK